MTRLSRLALMLSAVLAIPAQAAEETVGLPAEAANPLEELTKLEEVRVRGRLVANAVVAAETRFFRLYNQLNKDNRYDVHCGDMRLDDSLVMVRTCVPEFLDRYRPAQPYWIPTSAPPTCVGFCSGMRNPGFTGRYFGTPPDIPPVGEVAIWTAPPILVPETVRTEYKQNVLRVIHSDPELLELASTLAGMYHQMDRVQGRFMQLRLERQAARSAKLAAAKERARARGRELRPPPPRAM